MSSIDEVAWDDYVAVTPHNSNVNVYRALFVGSAGSLVVTTPANADVTFGNVPAGTLLKIQVIKVKATGTTATNIVGRIA